MNSPWNIEQVETDLNIAFKENSELKLLEILKNNSFLFHELYSRKYGIQPIFAEVPFGQKLRSDFLWLNDNSDGPEWVLVEIEKPNLELFTKKGEPTSYLNHAIEQVKSWDRFFMNDPSQKKTIFGAVARFRFILVAGSFSDWNNEKAIKWRQYHNLGSNIEIRSSGIFQRALEYAKSHIEEMWSFAEYPKSGKSTELEKYWRNNPYMDLFRKVQ